MQSCPITTGPRITLPALTTLRAPIRTRPSTRAPASTVPSILRSMSSRSRWFASRMSSGLPVSFHQPDDVGLELSSLDPQMVEGLRDLELVPPGRLEVADDRENRRAEQVD